jgi:hypothetical protein
MRHTAPEWSEVEIEREAQVTTSDLTRALRLLQEGSPMLYQMALAPAKVVTADEDEN